MATYVSTIRFTNDGVRAVGETTHRAAEVMASAQTLGIGVKEAFWTLGQFDGFLLFDAPDDETALALMLQVGQMGNVRTETTRAFNSQEMDQILARAKLV